jgi:hypothetical protein
MRRSLRDAGLAAALLLARSAMGAPVTFRKSWRWDAAARRYVEEK